MNQVVRESIAEQVSSVAPILGPDATLSELLPLIKVFLQDESIEIRRKALGSMAPIIETLGPESTEQNVLPQALQMARDPMWRVRLAVVETLPVYAKNLGLELFNSSLKDIQIAALHDNTARIREAAVENLTTLSKLFGDMWTAEAMLPVIRTAAQGQGAMMHLHRIMAVQAVGAVATSMQGQALEALVNDVVVPLSRDPVAAVRIASAATLHKISKGNESTYVRDTLRPILVELSADTDPDVKILADLALQG